MTVSNEPTSSLHRPPAPRTADQPQTFTAELGEVRRGPLRTTRDVLACIYYALASIIMILLLYFGGSFLNALGDSGLVTPDPATTCIGEEIC